MVSLVRAILSPDDVKQRKERARTLSFATYKAMKKLLINPIEYYHISFRGDLEGTWKPQLPYGEGSGGEFSEPSYPRICVSPSIKQCFWAVYPNVSKYFEVEKYPYMDFYVYVPNLQGVKFLDNDEVNRRKVVHDSHVTGEAQILSSAFMKLDSKVRIKNCTKNKKVMYYPFNDHNKTLRFLSHECDISLVERY